MVLRAARGASGRCRSSHGRRSRRSATAACAAWWPTRPAPCRSTATCSRASGSTRATSGGAADLARLPMLDKDLVRSPAGAVPLGGPRSARSALSFLTSGSTGRGHAGPPRPRARCSRNIAYGERERAPVIEACGIVPAQGAVRGQRDLGDEGRAGLLPGEHADAGAAPAPVRVGAGVRRGGGRPANAERPDILVGYGGWIDLFFRTVAGARHRASVRPSWSCTWPRRCRRAGASTSRASSASRWCRATARPRRSRSASSARTHRVPRSRGPLPRARRRTRTAAPVPPGEPGQLVISNLVNRASVLLNYPIGDVGSIGDDAVPAAAARCDRCPSSRAGWRTSSRCRRGLRAPARRLAGVQGRRGRAPVPAHPARPPGLRPQLTTLDDDAYRRALERALPELQRSAGRRRADRLGPARRDRGARRQVQSGRVPLQPQSGPTAAPEAPARRSAVTPSRAVRAHCARNGAGSAADQTASTFGRR